MHGASRRSLLRFGGAAIAPAPDGSPDALRPAFASCALWQDGTQSGSWKGSS